MTKQAWVLAAAIAISSVFGQSAMAAAVSPAQTLFDQAGFYLEFYYHGYGKKDIKAIEQKYQNKLDAACKGKENCGFPEAEKLVAQMFEEMEDGHTYYLEAQGADEFAASQQGNNTNAQVDDGLEFARIPGGTDFRVFEVREGSPAFDAGVERGDRIVAFNGKTPPADRQAFLEFYRPLLQDGRAYKLSVVRHETENKDLNIVPRQLELDDLPFMQMLANKVARIVVPNFDAAGLVGPRIHALVRRAVQQDAKAIVMDLRDDPGGTFTECMSGAGAFVGKILRIRETRFERRLEGYRDGRVFMGEDTDENILYEVRDPVRWTGPLAVMVNSNSASCSELFAADVQLTKAGVVIGEPTAGAGNTGAQIFHLVNGAAAVVTTTRTLQANATPYPERISPNVAVKDDIDLFVRRGRDLILEKSLENLGLTSLSVVPGSANVSLGIPLLHYNLLNASRPNWRLWK